MNRSIVLISSALMLALVAGCKSTSEWSGSQARKRPQMSMTPPMVTLTNTLDSALLQPGQSLFTLGPGDALDIELWANPLSRTLTLVGPDGKIYYNLLPGLDVWGLTLPQTTDLLEKELGKYLNSPHVAVTLRHREQVRVDAGPAQQARHLPADRADHPAGADRGGGRPLTRGVFYLD
jgi:protein involved in polysaccharide export with SLBB domain